MSVLTDICGPALSPSSRSRYYFAGEGFVARLRQFTVREERGKLTVKPGGEGKDREGNTRMSTQKEG